MSKDSDDREPSLAAPTEQSGRNPYQQRLAEQADVDFDTQPPGSGWDAFRARWGSLSSRQKLRAKQLGVAAAVSVLGYGLYAASSADAPIGPAPSASKLDMGAGLRGDSLEVKLRGDLKKVLDGQNLLANA